jgi:hypothetical protein
MRHFDPVFAGQAYDASPGEMRHPALVRPGGVEFRSGCTLNLFRPDPTQEHPVSNRRKTRPLSDTVTRLAQATNGYVTTQKPSNWLSGRLIEIDAWGRAGELIGCPHVVADWHNEVRVIALWRPQLLSCRRRKCVEQLGRGLTAQQQRTCDRCDRIVTVIHPMTVVSERPDAAAMISFGLCCDCQAAEGGHLPHVSPAADR